MLTPYLSPIKNANAKEIELYYLVEETMQRSGALNISEKQIFNEIDSHYSMNHLKVHDNFHYFSFAISIFISFLAYRNYQVNNKLDHSTLLMIALGLGMMSLAWIVAHPKLKYEEDAQDYFRTHRPLFIYNK